MDLENSKWKMTFSSLGRKASLKLEDLTEYFDSPDAPLIPLAVQCYKVAAETYAKVKASETEVYYQGT